MATLGQDCQVIIDGTGYFVEPHTYVLHRPRIRRATVVKGGGERYVDLGPGKREWHMTILCVNQLTDYTGVQVALTGRGYREALRVSYEKSAVGGVLSLSYTDVDGVVYSVHFDHMDEVIPDVRTQLQTPSYHCPIVLVEA